MPRGALEAPRRWTHNPGDFSVIIQNSLPSPTQKEELHRLATTNLCVWA